MNELQLRFVELLFRNDREAMAAAWDALNDPPGFVTQFGHEFGWGNVRKGWAPDPWDLILCVGELRGWVWTAEFNFFPDEVATMVADLIPARTMSVDWDGLAAEHSETGTEEFLRSLARAIPAGERLVSLDNGSDSFPLAFFPEASVAEAAQLASELGGRLDLLDQ